MDLTAAGFGATLTGVLPELQTMAESRMLDLYDIFVQSGEPEYNPDTKQDEIPETLLFNTKGRVKSTGTVAQNAQVGERTVVSVSRELHIPVGSQAVPTNAYAVPTFLHWSSDQTLAGSRLRLAGPAPGSQTTARRLQIEEVLT